MADVENRHDEIQGEIVHEYDGIEEADNQLPTWWLITFIGSMVFAVGYWFYYHEFEVGPLPMERYSMELSEKAAQTGEVSAEMLAAMAQSSSDVQAGEQIFMEHCAVCHKEQGQGNIGPNLTDPYWIHGGSPTDIYSTIEEGVGDKGMPAWGPTLGPQATQRVAAYVLTLEGTNVEGKAPEGELWDPGAADEAAGGDAPEAASSEEGAAEAPAGREEPETTGGEPSSEPDDVGDPAAAADEGTPPPT